MLSAGAASDFWGQGSDKSMKYQKEVGHEDEQKGLADSVSLGVSLSRRLLGVFSASVAHACGIIAYIGEVATTLTSTRTQHTQFSDITCCFRRLLYQFILQLFLTFSPSVCFGYVLNAGMGRTAMRPQNTCWRVYQCYRTEVTTQLELQHYQHPTQTEVICIWPPPRSWLLFSFVSILWPL